MSAFSGYETRLDDFLGLFPGELFLTLVKRFGSKGQLRPPFEIAHFKSVFLKLKF